MTGRPRSCTDDWRLTSSYCLSCHTPLGRGVGDVVPFPDEHPMVHLCNACTRDARYKERMGEKVLIRYVEMPVELIMGKRRGRGRPPKDAPPDPFGDPGLTQVMSRMMEAEQHERVHYAGSPKGEEIRAASGRRRVGETFEIEGEEVDVGGVSGESEDGQGGR
jgi:hypothetical protein